MVNQKLLKIFKSDEMTIAFLSAVYFIIFVLPGRGRLETVGIVTGLAAANIIFSLSQNRIEEGALKGYANIISVYLIFSAFFVIGGELHIIFYLMFFVLILVAAVNPRIVFVLLLITVYIVIQYFDHYASRDFSVVIVLLESVFLTGAVFYVRRQLDRADISPFHNLLAIRRRNAAETLYVISKTISKSSNIDDILFKIATSLGVFTNLERSSIILVDKDMKKGRIAASFEGKHLRNLEIDIAKYPEIKKALKEDKIITIENIRKSPILQEVVSDLPPLQNQSIMVIPVSTREEQLGVLFLRGHRENKGFTKEEIRFCETVATTSAQALMNVRMIEELSESANEKQKMIEKLGKMNIELEKADKLKSTFLANVSHELRTPLTSIMGYLQILAEQEIATVEGIKYVDTIKSNSETLLRLINGLIDISKIESGTFELFYEKAHLNEIIEYVCDIFSPVFDKENIICNLRLQRFNTPFYFDVNRIEQVLSNLLSNAVKFSPTGQKIIIKSAFAEKRAEVTIKDDGIGIDEKNQKIIFQRFTQVDSSRSREHEGSGIGLHLCHEITKRHGGKIWVKSKPGKGSAFKFRIPMITSEEDLAKWLDKSMP